MSDYAILIIGVGVSALCVAFVWFSYVGLREAGRGTEERPVARRVS